MRYKDNLGLGHEPKFISQFSTTSFKDESENRFSNLAHKRVLPVFRPDFTGSDSFTSASLFKETDAKLKSHISNESIPKIFSTDLCHFIYISIYFPLWKAETDHFII